MWESTWRGRNVEQVRLKGRASKCAYMFAPFIRTALLYILILKFPRGSWQVMSLRDAMELREQLSVRSPAVYDELERHGSPQVLPRLLPEFCWHINQ